MTEGAPDLLRMYVSDERQFRAAAQAITHCLIVEMSSQQARELAPRIAEAVTSSMMAAVSDPVVFPHAARMAAAQTLLRAMDGEPMAADAAASLRPLLGGFVQSVRFSPELAQALAEVDTVLDAALTDFLSFAAHDEVRRGLNAAITRGLAQSHRVARGLGTEPRTEIEALTESVSDALAHANPSFDYEGTVSRLLAMHAAGDVGADVLTSLATDLYRCGVPSAAVEGRRIVETANTDGDPISSVLMLMLYEVDLANGLGGPADPARAQVLHDELAAFHEAARRHHTGDPD